MDTGKGYFETGEDENSIIKKLIEKGVISTETTPERMKDKTFRVGEEVMVKDSRFMIKKIVKKGMVLRLLPKE